MFFLLAQRGKTAHMVVVTVQGAPPLANVARLLLDRGADINARNNSGRTPLHTSTYMERIEVVRVLLERGADVGAEDDQGSTPFSLAKIYGYDEIMKLLSEHGADSE